MTDALERHLEPLGFVRYEIESDAGVELLAAWRRRTWNTNRAVALIEVPPDVTDVGAWAQQIKEPVGKALGYLTFFYPVGLQLVLMGQRPDLDDEALAPYTDKVDTQTVVLQSIHVIDPTDGSLVTARTWGQVITGRFQDAIVNALGELGPRRGSRGVQSSRFEA